VVVRAVLRSGFRDIVFSGVQSLRFGFKVNGGHETGGYNGVSPKPDRKTAHKTAQINSDERASPMTSQPHTTSSAHQTVALLVTVACACVSAQ